jgi:hypothetical protein
VGEFKTSQKECGKEGRMKERIESRRKEWIESCSYVDALHASVARVIAWLTHPGHTELKVLVTFHASLLCTMP